MTFAEAVLAMVAGEKMSRPRKFREQEAHYINPTATKDDPAFLINEGGIISPWTPLLADMQADDWEVYVAPKPKKDLGVYRNPGRAIKIK